MLNEIHLLANALSAAGLSVAPQHPRVSTPGKSGPAFYVLLQDAGHVAAIYEVTEDEWPGLWTIKEGNQNSFPIVRPTVQLLAVPVKEWKETIEEANKKREGVASATFVEVAKRFQLAPAGKDASLFARLQRKAKELQSVGSAEPKLEQVEVMAKRFLLASQNPDQLRSELVQSALAKVTTGEISGLNSVQNLLFGKLEKDKLVTTVQLAFVTREGGPRSVFDSKIRRAVEGALPREAHINQPVHRAQGSAYGDEAELQTSAFPKVRLPVINKDVPLISMFSDAGCNERYGLTDSAIVPVSKVAASRMQDALFHIVALERKGRTWCSAPSGRFEQSASGRKSEKQDLLIAFVDGQPETPTAGLFVPDAALTTKQFEVDAAAICDALESIAQQEPLSKLQLFVIRQASEGQCQIALAESPRVSEVLAGARWWQEAAANLPHIRLDLPASGKQKDGQATPPVPYPSQVVSLLSWKWGLNGEPTAVSGPSLGEVLAVMLRVSGRWKDAAEHLLDMAIDRISPLLLAAGGCPDSLGRQQRETALIGASSLGIMLAAFSRRKEEYMSSPAFLVGQMLSLADTLHRAYCLEVREGQVPPQLIGHALMPTARFNLQEALERLGERIHVYQAWATTASVDSKSDRGVRLGKWALGQLGAVSSQLSGADLPAEVSQLDRAELLLGYLARISLDGGNDKEEDDD